MLPARPLFFFAYLKRVPGKNKRFSTEHFPVGFKPLLSLKQSLLSFFLYKNTVCKNFEAETEGMILHSLRKLLTNMSIEKEMTCSKR